MVKQILLYGLPGSAMNRGTGGAGPSNCTPRTPLIAWLLTFAVLALAPIGLATAQSLDTVPDFDTAIDFKALARADEVFWGAAAGYCSVEAAAASALAECEAALKEKDREGECHLSRIGDLGVAELTNPMASEEVGNYRRMVEDRWLALSRASKETIEVSAYGGGAEGWDEFISGLIRYDPAAACMAEVEGAGPSIRCKGYSRYAGRLHEDDEYPSFGEGLLRCTNGQELRGETISLTPGAGFACFSTPGGGQVKVIFGPGSHALATDRESFLRSYEWLVTVSGLDRDLCGWGLLTS